MDCNNAGVSLFVLILLHIRKKPLFLFISNYLFVSFFAFAFCCRWFFHRLHSCYNAVVPFDNKVIFRFAYWTSRAERATNSNERMTFYGDLSFCARTHMLSYIMSLCEQGDSMKHCSNADNRFSENFMFCLAFFPLSRLFLGIGF